MKKNCLLVFLLGFTWIYSPAQKTQVSHFGLKAGFNHTVINGVETNGAATGYSGSTIYGAVFYDKNLYSTTFLNAEVLFSWVNDWHFIEIPVHIRQELGKRVSLFVGPKIDLSANELDQRKPSNSKFLGVSAELGTRYGITKRIFAEGRYSVGLSKQFFDPDFDINYGKRNNLRFGAGIYF